MKRFISLTIKHPDVQRLYQLFLDMADSKGYPFVYQKQASTDYARNVFLEKGEAACFKTGRKTLFEAVVWLVITKNQMVVTNITSTINNNLGISNYNKILNVFYEEYLKHFIDHSFEVIKTPDTVSLTETISDETYHNLIEWEHSCDKLDPISHFEDRARWFNFIISEHDNKDELIPDDLQKWLIEDCHWETEPLRESAGNVAILFEYGRDLLNHTRMKDEAEE